MTEWLTHGGETWFVRRRSFAKFVDPEKHRLDERHVAFWAAAPPGVTAELVAAEPALFFVPPYVGHRGWLGLRLDLTGADALDETELAGIAADAYREVAPKTLVHRLDG